jgi:dihydrofolate reductase
MSGVHPQPMRPVRYNVAASLDGYIATAGGGYDWIPHDPTVDFAALFAKVDTVLLGRKSFELVQRAGSVPWSRDTRVYVFSTTLRQADHPAVIIVGASAGEVVASLRAETGGGEIWLFGGGELFRSMLQAGQVDRVEVTIVPILLGGGVPLSLPGAPQARLTLTDTHRYPSGMVTLSYDVANRTG